MRVIAAQQDQIRIQRQRHVHRVAHIRERHIRSVMQIREKGHPLPFERSRQIRDRERHLRDPQPFCLHQPIGQA